MRGLFSIFLPLWTKYSSTGLVQAPIKVPPSLTATEELTPVASLAQCWAQSSPQCTRKLLPRWGNWGKRTEASDSVALRQSKGPREIPLPSWQWPVTQSTGVSHWPLHTWTLQILFAHQRSWPRPQEDSAQPGCRTTMSTPWPPSFHPFPLHPIS